MHVWFRWEWHRGIVGSREIFVASQLQSPWFHLELRLLSALRFFACSCLCGVFLTDQKHASRWTAYAILPQVWISMCVDWHSRFQEQNQNESANDVDQGFPIRALCYHVMRDLWDCDGSDRLCSSDYASQWQIMLVRIRLGISFINQVFKHTKNLLWCICSW